MPASLGKVLIVDDSKLIHQMYKLLLMRYHSCEVIDAMNGLEALEALAKETDFDLILLDINMPVINGVQFLEKIKESGRFQHIPIIVISTEGKEEDTIRAMHLGAWGYIIKPLKPEMLYNLIEKVLAKRQSLVASGKC